jgi:hypothetical protein
MGFLPLSAGQITILGQPVRDRPEIRPCRLCPASRRGGLVLPRPGRGRGDDGPLRPHGFPSPPHRHRPRQAVTAALARVGMTDYRHRQIGELSGGQKKRVFLARALAQEGQVILLDEPFTGVDVQTEEADHHPSARPSRRRKGDAGFDPQPGLGPRILRPDRAGQGHRPGATARPKPPLPATTWNAPSAASCATSSWAAPTCTTTKTAARSRILTDDERPFVHLRRPHPHPKPKYPREA